MEKKQTSFMDYTEGLLRRIPKFMVFVFIASVLVFCLIHGYCMTNQFVNQDNALISSGYGGIYGSLYGSLYGGDGGLNSGRFLLGAVSSLSSNYTMPWLIGLLSAVYFGFSMCAVVRLFDIKHRLSAVLAAVVIASFPTACSTMSYMYTADAYFFALMLVSFGALLAFKYKYGWIGAAFLFAASLGIYQAYFCFGASLLVFALLLLFVREELPAKEMIMRCLRCFISLAAALVIYKLVLDLLLKINNTELVNYMGLDHMWYISVWDLKQRIKDAYSLTFKFFVIYKFFPSYVRYAYIVYIAALAVLLISSVIKNKIYRSPVRFILIIILLLIAPLACSLIVVMCEGFHLLMIYPVVMQIAVGVAALDGVKICDKKSAVRILRSSVSAVLLCAVLLLSAGGIVVTNKAYLKMDVVFKTSYAFCLKLMGRIEMTEGYEVGMPVALIGNVGEENRPTQVPEMRELDNLTGIPTEYTLIGRRVIPAICKYYIGDGLELADVKDFVMISSSPEFAEMNIYPYENSIRVINGVMTVKLGEPAEKE
ncbi:MAG: glucosyltransferase domain-containing protein [Candidatus Limivicinus sp.]|jgi:hypothetical protein